MCPEQIISASGVQHGLIINPDGSINNHLGSAWTNVGSVVVSGTIPINLIGVGSLVASGITSITGSVTIEGVGSIVASGVTTVTGSVIDLQTVPTDASKNNPLYNFKYIISGTAAGVTGSAIGSIIQTIGAGSSVQVITYTADLITKIGSWV